MVPDPARSRAVLIGTGRYTGPTEDLPSIEAGLDSLAWLLCSPEVWGLPPRHCTVVRDPATHAELIEPIIAAATGATDTLLVYYAGHGLRAGSSAELHLALTGSSVDNAAYAAVPYGLVRDQLIGTRAQRQLVILDCCYSGLALGRLAAGGGSDAATMVAEEAETAGAYLIAAAAETKTALAPQGEPYTAFTGELLRVLRDGVSGKGPFLNVDTIFRQVESALRARQRPLPKRRVRDNLDRLVLVHNRAHQRDTTTESDHPDTTSEPERPHAFAPTHLRTLVTEDVARTVAFTPDGRKLAVAYLRGATLLTLTGQGEIRLPHGKFLDRVLDTAYYMNDLALSPDGHHLATITNRSTRLWELRHNKVVLEIKGGGQRVAYSPDGRFLATVGHDTVHIWDTTTAAEVLRLVHSTHVSGVAFHPDGTVIATTGTRAARLWDARAGTRLRDLKHVGSFDTGLAFSPDGRYLATGGRDQSARVWDVATGDTIVTVVAESDPPKSPRPIVVHTEREHPRHRPERPRYEVTTVAFSPNGRLLATAIDDGTTRLWELSTRAELLKITHEKARNGVAFSPDGTLLAAHSYKTIQLWSITG